MIDGKRVIDIRWNQSFAFYEGISVFILDVNKQNYKLAFTQTLAFQSTLIRNLYCKHVISITHYLRLREAIGLHVCKFLFVFSVSIVTFCKHLHFCRQCKIDLVNMKQPCKKVITFCSVFSADNHECLSGKIIHSNSNMSEKYIDNY